MTRDNGLLAFGIYLGALAVLTILAVIMWLKGVV